jgi:hypothetical protein
VTEDLVYRIHPAIGVARVGDARGDGDFFVGPEVPGLTPPGPRKAQGAVLRQAARFRVFAYRREGTSLILHGEVRPGVEDVVEIRWQVHLANRKAAFFQFDGLRGESGRHHEGDDMAPRPRRNVGPPADWEIDPGPRPISSRSTAPVRFDAASGGRWPRDANGHAAIDYLGELRTDADGHLLVLGGRGTSVSTISPPAMLPHYANNPTWLDDVSDGPVTAAVVVSRGGVEREIPVDDDGKAWVLVGPPDFAPEITSVVTLYDVLVDMAARHLDVPDESVYSGPLAWLKALNDELRGGATSLATYRPDYVRDVFPAFERAVQYRWVHERAATAHFDAMSDPALADPTPAAEQARLQIFRRLRRPGAPFAPRQTMPRLLGDEPYEDFPQAEHRRRLAVTRTQFAMLERWRDGHFDAPATVPVPGRARPVDPAAITPWGLDEAALQNCVGGAFYPGIEASWQIRHPELFIAPFRIRHGARSTFLTDDDVVRAGHFSRQMAVPWQADFMDCHQELHAGSPETTGVWGWWPSQRPDDVRIVGEPSMVPWVREGLADHEWMVANWGKQGFVLRVGTTDEFVEQTGDGTP